MRCFITGIGGFIGTHLARALRDGGHEVTGLSLEPGGPGVRRGDILDPPSLRAALIDTSPDVVFHLAAFAATGGAEKRPDEAMRVNVEGTLHVLEAVRSAAPESRVVLPTSAAVYGVLQEGEIPATEETPLRPAHPYAVSKVCVHYLGHAFARAYSLEVVEARLFNVIGPGQQKGFVVPDLAAQLAAGAAELRVQRLDTSRDFVDVRDAVRALAWMAGGGKAGEVYHVCSGVSTSIQRIVDLLVEACGRRVKVVDTGEGGPGAKVSVGSFAKLAAACDWKPEIPIEQSVRDVYADWAARTQVAS